MNRLSALNQTQRRAIEDAIGAAKDNLYRAQMQQRAMPTWISGNGETIDAVIAGYQRRLDELREGL